MKLRTNLMWTTCNLTWVGEIKALRDQNWVLRRYKMTLQHLWLGHGDKQKKSKRLPPRQLQAVAPHAAAGRRGLPRSCWHLHATLSGGLHTKPKPISTPQLMPFAAEAHLRLSLAAQAFHFNTYHQHKQKPQWIYTQYQKTDIIAVTSAARKIRFQELNMQKCIHLYFVRLYYTNIFKAVFL